MKEFVIRHRLVKIEASRTGAFSMGILFDTYQDPGLKRWAYLAIDVLLWGLWITISRGGRY